MKDSIYVSLEKFDSYSWEGKGSNFGILPYFLAINAFSLYHCHFCVMIGTLHFNKHILCWFFPQKTGIRIGNEGPRRGMGA